MTLSLMTYNIRLGIESSLAEVGFCAAAGGSPDLLALQEVGVRWQMGEPVDQPAVLAEQLGLPYSAFAGALTDRSGGRFGVALLSRWPLLSVDVALLPRLEDEQRVLLHVLVDSEPRIHVFNTHLSIHAPERLLQARRLAETLAHVRGPTLVMGDFNDLPGSEVHETIRAGVDQGPGAGQALVDLFDAKGEGAPLTFSVREPNRRIDYLMCGGGLRPLSARVRCEAEASDHFPLIGTVDFPAPVGGPPRV